MSELKLTGSCLCGGVSYEISGEAGQFWHCHCSLMPRIAPDNSIAVVPAGTLDEDPGIRPQGRIFQDSRSNWSCDNTELPTFDTYPR